MLKMLTRQIMRTPYQPLLLNKYQINVGFSCFRGIGILSGMNEHNILTTSNRYCQVMWFLQLENYIYLILKSILPTNHDFKDGNKIYMIFSRTSNSLFKKNR